MNSPAPLPNDLAEAHALILQQRQELAAAEARASGAAAMIAHLKLVIAKLRRDQYGQSAERGRKLLDQLELQLEELEADATERSVIAERDTSVQAFTRRRPVRAPLPAHLPRERVVIPAPCACPFCGGKLAKRGEDSTETGEVVPRQGKVIQTVREKFSCRSCEKITQPPAPFHPIARARAGASLLAMILYAKFGQHQPLNRQSAVYAREGIELDTSTLADWVGACSATLMPLIELIGRHVLAASRLHGDDTTVPVLAKNKTVTGRLWTYVRDDRPFRGHDPPAALFFYSPNRGGEHPRRHLAGWAGILQADAYAGFGELYDGRRRPGPITEAACWGHARRKFFVLADLRQAPLAIEAVRRIDAIFTVERDINGAAPEQRLLVRQQRIKTIVAELESWMRGERARLSRHAEVAKAIDYMLKRWPSFTRFLDDGRICLTNNAAERYPSGVGRPSAVGRDHRRFDVRLRRGEGSVHRFGYGHKQAATAASVLAGIVEARGCGGNVDAGFVGVAGGATVRRERQPGLRVAPALPGRCGRAERATIDAGDGDVGPPGRDGIGPTG